MLADSALVAPLVMSTNYRTQVPSRYRAVNPASTLANRVTSMVGVSRVSVEQASKDEPVYLYYTVSRTVDGDEVFRKIHALLKVI